MVVSDVRRGNDRVNSGCLGNAGQPQGILHRRGPVVEAGQDVAGEVDQGVRLTISERAHLRDHRGLRCPRPTGFVLRRRYSMCLCADLLAAREADGCG